MTTSTTAVQSSIKISEKEKFDKESSDYPIPSGWELISGDVKNIKKLLKDPNSTAELVFRRKAPKECTATTASMAATPSTKKYLGAEFQEIRISRVSEEQWDITGDRYAPKIKTGFRPIALTISDISHKLQIVTGWPSRLFSEYKNMPITDDPSDLLPCANGFWINDYPEHNTTRKGYSFLIGGLREYMKKVYFHLLIETTLFTEEEANYFSQMVDAKEVSEHETLIYEKMNAIINGKDSAKYDECITLAKVLHTVSLEEAKKYHRTLYREYDPITHKPINIVFFDEQETAYTLGLMFKTISPQHALQAFSILGKGSPLYNAAQEHITNLKLILSDTDMYPSTAKTTTDISNIRAMRAEGLLKIQNLNEPENMRLFSRFMDIHCGFNSFSSNRLFANMESIKRVGENTNTETLLSILEPLFIMVDYIYDKNKIKNPVISSFQGLNYSSKAINTVASASNLYPITIDEKQKKESQIISNAASATTPPTATSANIISAVSSKNDTSASFIDSRKQILIGNPEHEKEKSEKEIIAAMPEGWTWVSGDHTSLFNEVDSKEILVFKRNKYLTAADQGFFEPADAPNPAQPNAAAVPAVDIKNTKDNPPFEVTQIKIARTKLVRNPIIQKSMNPKESFDENNRPLTIILYFANASNNEMHRIYPNISGYNDFPTILRAAFMHNNFEESDNETFRELIGDPVPMSIPMIQNKIDLYPNYLVQAWKDELIRKGVWTEKEASFFVNFCPKPTLSPKELKLREETEKCLVKQDYDKAVLNAADVHALSRERNRKNHFVISIRDIGNDSFKSIDYLETEDFGYRLGERLLNLSAYHAYHAFKLITEYSPLYSDAQKHMTQLAIKLARIASENEEWAERRDYLKKAMMHHLYLLDTKDINPPLFFNLIMQLSGLSQAEGSDFSKILQEKLENVDIWSFLVKTKLVLADKIYALNSKSNDIISPNSTNVAHTNADPNIPKENKPILLSTEAHIANSGDIKSGSNAKASGTTDESAASAANIALPSAKNTSTLLSSAKK